MSVKRNLWSVGICWIGDSFKERTRRVMSSKRATKLLLAVTIAVGLGLLLPRISRCLRGWIVEWRISRYTASIEKHARAQSLPPDLVRAVIRAESAGNPRAVSISQARGLMQINAVTEQEIRERFRLPADRKSVV